MRIKIAFIYDFDKTLSPKDMQEYSFLPEIEIKPKVFWEDVRKKAQEQGLDNILTYMHLMLKKADNKDKKSILTEKSLNKLGNDIELYKGVKEWFNKINQYASSNYKAQIEHYIISSGNKEIIEGSAINSEFKRIYGCKFLYDDTGVAIAPGLAINYTNKTQFIFRINKGLLDEQDNTQINKFIPYEERPIPFRNIVYFGDGETDVPCMKLVKDLGGYSIAVYEPNTKKNKVNALLNDNRINFYFPANYEENQVLYKTCKIIIDKMVSQSKLTDIENKQKKNLKNKKKAE